MKKYLLFSAFKTGVRNNFIMMLAGCLTYMLPLIFLILAYQVVAQETVHTVMFYNVENLFDTRDDTLKNDDEFLPDGDRNWNNHRFYHKLNNIAKVIIALGEWQAPAVIGLCEVENRFVLNQLIYETPLEKFDYGIIHYESPDWRGIDVALLYRKSLFMPDTSFVTALNFPFDPGSKTRDILYLKGRFNDSDTIHFFVNHWPSRYGGYLQSKPKREFAAGLLRNRIDSLLGVHPGAKIIVMGDFNDSPADESVLNVLGAKSPERPIDDPLGLINLMFPALENNMPGTLKYRESWDVFDQFIVSSGLLDADSGYTVESGRAFIFNPGFLLEEDKRYLGYKPFRTFYGFDYRGGFSDHLPVYIKLIEVSKQ